MPAPRFCASAAPSAAIATFSGRTTELRFDSTVTLEHIETDLPDYALEPAAARYPFAYAPELAKDLEPYRQVDTPGVLLKAFLADFVGRNSGTIALLIDLNRKVREEIAYGTRLEPGVQTSEETLEKRSGSCRDSAWLLVQSLRNLGVAARFVSGYLIQLAAEEGSPDGPKTDSADLHAWAEAFLPGAGWIGLDPTSGLLAGEGHIPLVCTPNASQASPISGTASE